MPKNDFSPYVDNGGTVVAIAGPDFCVIGGDTRLSVGYNILSRDKSKIFEAEQSVFLASGGMQADIDGLRRRLAIDVKNYRDSTGSAISAPAFATLLHTTLYYKRFFPFYTFNMVAGLDEAGRGALFTYDAVGNMEGRPYAAQGSGQQLVLPPLDRALRDRAAPLGRDEAVELVKAAFLGAAERDIHTGDTLELVVVTRTGAERDRFDLRKD